MTTISTSTTLGVVLNTASYSNPVVIETGVSISGPANAVFGNHGASGYFVIQNYGVVAGSSIDGKGIYLSPGGSVTNAASGSISGNRGVGIYGAAGTVVNQGSIGGTGDKGIGVVLNSGGLVSNAGSIIGFDGVKVLGGGSVVNNGGIAASEVGVYLFSGGALTNTGSGFITGYADGVLISVAAGTVVNQGSIAGTAASGVGVYLNHSGLVTNAATGAITGVFDGVEIGGYGTLINAGIVAATGTSGSGVFLNAGGVVTNVAAGSIEGVFGVALVGSGGTVANAGSIVSTGTYTRGAGVAGGVAVYVRAGASVTNATLASIVGIVGGVGIAGGLGTVVNDGSIASTGSASYGVYLASGGTLTNAGTIDATNAVAFGGTDSNLLVLDPGFSISGAVTGSASASNTLELGSAGSAGVVTGLGSQFTNFGPIVFDTGADWSVTGNTAGLAGVISGFTVGDTIELTGVNATGSSFGGGILTLSETIGFATLDVQGPFALVDFVVTPNGEGTEVTVIPCFAGGTRIACRDGERAVEALVPGDVVRLAGGGCAAIEWIGHRHLDCRRHPKPVDVWPVRVRAGAFAAGRPHRDLMLSPDHAVFVDGVLIPVRYLINGRTIVQEPVDAVTYYHVELSSHSVMLAEGLPCESYLDTGNRGAFSNAEMANAG